MIRALSDLSYRCFADGCGKYWARGVGGASIPPATATESILTALLNELSAVPESFNLSLTITTFLTQNRLTMFSAFCLSTCPQMHLVIATREDPDLPLARLRARGQLTELRVTDLRFTPSEAAGFLNQMMGLNLSTEDIAALEDARKAGLLAYN